MIKAPPANKMMVASPMVKTAEDGSQDQGAVKAEGRVFRRVLGRCRRYFEGIRRQEGQ